MAYNRSKAQSNQADILISFFRLIGGNKLYSGLMGLIILTALLSLVLPNAAARRTAENTAFALAGGGIAVGALSSKSGEVRSQAEKAKALSEELAKKLSAQELAIQKQSIAIQARNSALDTQEATYKQRCENASEKRLQRELEAGKRRFQAEANKAVREAESRLKSAEKNLAGVIAQHQKIQADAQLHYQSKIDSTALEHQVNIDRLSSEIAAAKEETTTARQELSRASRELEALKEHYGQINQQVDKKVAKAAQTVFESQSAILAEAGTEAEKAMQKAALELQWEKRERLKLKVENASGREEIARLRGPKFFKQASLEGKIANQIIARMAAGEDKVLLSEGQLGDTKFGECVMSFEPLGCGVEDVNKKIDQVALDMGLTAIPKAYFGGDGTIKMRVRVSGDRKPQVATISRVSEARLKRAFLAINYGLRVTGYTGRGKSTLLNNIIGLYEREMGQPFTIFDPKVDFPSAKYPNNKVYRGPNRCVDNIDLIGTVCESRQDYRVLNDEQGVAIPAQHRVPRLFLIDECKDIHDSAALKDAAQKPAERHYVKDFKFSIQKGLEVGRGLKVRVVYSTVTPDSSDFGFKNSVFKQSATVFLGDQCYEALSTKSQYLTTVSDEKKASLRQEYEARVSSNDERDKFVGLFFNGGTNEVFLFSPPMPEAWKIQKPIPPNNGVSPEIQNQPTLAETQAAQAAHSSPKVAQPKSGLKSGLKNATVESLKVANIKCPHCKAVANSFKDKRIRKSDSTVRVRCKTKDCPSSGEFRVSVTGQNL